MLNINDIRARLKVRPEPQEVNNIRQIILDSFKNLEFVEDGHKYYHQQESGEKEEVISVSAFVHQFEQPADWDEIANSYAVRHNMDVEEVKRKWRENNLRSTNTGTGVHLFGECYQYFVMDELEKISPIIRPQYEDGFLIPHSKKEDAIVKFYSDLFNQDTYYPVLAETKVYLTSSKDLKLKKHGYAGTFDMLFATNYGGRWRLLIYDYKTNGSLTSSYNENNSIMMLPPFDDMVDEAISHYTIQLSAYALTLQQLGFEIGGRSLIWLKEDGTYEKKNLPDVSGRILSYLKS